MLCRFFFPLCSLENFNTLMFCKPPGNFPVERKAFAEKIPGKERFCRKNPSRSCHKQHWINTQFPSTKATCYLHNFFLLHISNGFCCAKLRISKDLMSLYRNIAYMLKSKPIKIWINLLIWFFWMPHMRHTNKLPRSIH